MKVVLPPIIRGCGVHRCSSEDLGLFDRATREMTVSDSSVDEFMKNLGGEVGGHVRGNDWDCVCGESGTADDEHQAALALYFHRRANHAGAGEAGS